MFLNLSWLTSQVICYNIACRKHLTSISMKHPENSTQADYLCLK